MAKLLKQNVEEATFLDSYTELSSLSLSTGTPRAIVHLTPDLRTPDTYIGERLRRDVVVDGVTTTEQYFNQLWLVSDLDNSESNHTVDDYMLCILEYKFVDPTANALTIPDDIVTLEEV